MIKKCVYSKDKFEIEFEWPLSEEVIKTTESIRSFIDRVALLPSTAVLRKDNCITGLIFSYKDFCGLLRPFSAKGKGVQTVEEFQHFFSGVREQGEA